MPDQNLNKALIDLGIEINKINTARGWTIPNQDDWSREDCRYRIPTFLAVVHSEVSEALEAFRKEDRLDFAEELADIVIRVLSLASGLEVDLGAEINAKLEKNRQRPFRHGGKKI